MAPITQKLFNAEPDDPLRCQGAANNGGGQCRYLSIAGLVRDTLWVEIDEGVDYTIIDTCPKHRGTQRIEKQQKQKAYDYRLQIWQQRVSEFAESDRVKTLRGEIGILRLLVEEILAKCSDRQELMLYSSKIASLIMQIEKLVRSCDRLESSMGMLLDKAGALVLAGEIVDVISTHIQDPAIIDAISGGIIDAISSLTETEK